MLYDLESFRCACNIINSRRGRACAPEMSGIAKRIIEDCELSFPVVTWPVASTDRCSDLSVEFPPRIDYWRNYVPGRVRCLIEILTERSDFLATYRQEFVGTIQSAVFESPESLPLLALLTGLCHLLLGRDPSACGILLLKSQLF
jgi:hypothetical protein